MAYAASGRAAEADALASALTTEPGHAATGHGLRVRLAIDAGDEALALARLSDFAAAAAMPDTAAVEAFGSALALVAATFPEADLSGIAGLGASRGMAAASLTDGRVETVGAGAALALRGAAEALVDGLDVYPNPTDARSTVRLSLATAATNVSVEIYDALGRSVATLTDGPLAAGAHGLVFDAAALPPGLYVVQARVTSTDGAVWSEVRRVIVAR